MINDKKTKFFLLDKYFYINDGVQKLDKFINRFSDLKKTEVTDLKMFYDDSIDEICFEFYQERLETDLEYNERIAVEKEWEQKIL